MVQRLTPARFGDLVQYCRGATPRDEWEFAVGQSICRVVNDWRAGARLMVDGVEMARNDDLFSVRASKPFLTAEIVADGTAFHRIEIYLRAILRVKIRVHVDGVPLQRGFV